MAVDRFSVATGVWSATSTWSDTEGGAAGAAVAGTTDTAFGLDGFTVTVDDASRAAYIVNIGKASDSGGTLTFASGSNTKLTIDDTAGAGINLRHTSAVLTDAGDFLGGYKSEVVSAGGLSPTNKWKLARGSGAISPTVTTRRTIMTGCSYGLIPLDDSATGLSLYAMTFRNLRASQSANIVKHRPLGTTSGITDWMGATERTYTVDFLYNYDTDPFLLDQLNRFMARN